MQEWGVAVQFLGREDGALGGCVRWLGAGRDEHVVPSLRPPFLWGNFFSPRGPCVHIAFSGAPAFGCICTWSSAHVNRQLTCPRTYRWFVVLVYTACLYAHIHTHLCFSPVSPLQVTRIEEEEYCLIPMGGVLPKHPQRVLALGGTAGELHGEGRGERGG